MTMITARHVEPHQVTWEEYLRAGAAPREMIDDFLHRPTWAQFDAELGYILHNSLVRWGIDGCRTIATFQPNGARSGHLYTSRKPRINSYGNSFTECNQVSDGETWQEYLGGHFAEPIGNFGVGGYGVYQAYRRMLREEVTPNGARNIVLYIWGDDPTRSLMRARWGAIYPWFQDETLRKRVLFHGNPWAHIEMDLGSGLFVEKENPLAAPDDVYKLCDPQWMLDHLSDDLAVHLTTFVGLPSHGRPGLIRELDRRRVSLLADALSFPFKWDCTESYVDQAAALLNIYGQHATNYILDKARTFAQSRFKNLLIVINYTARTDYFRQPLVPYDGVRRDQLIIDHLARENFSYFDMNLIHENEFTGMNGSFSDYMSRYHVRGASHYNPRGNHFFAYSIKDKLLDILDPMPISYRDATEKVIDFSGYLPNT